VLSDNELIRVQDVSRNMKRPVTLYVNLTGNQDAFENNLANIARQLQGVSLDQIRIEEGGVSPFPGKPSLTLCNGEFSNITYLVFPEGQEFGPFLDAIAWLGMASVAPDFKYKQSIHDCAFPIEVWTFVAGACPHCPDAVRSVLTVALANPLIRVSVIDSLYFGEISEKYKIKSTPTIIVNDGLTFVGGIKTNQFAEKLITLNDDGSMPEALRSMIQAGRAEDAAAMLCDRQRADAIVPIYLSNEFSQRMGALLVMEEALDRNPRILDPILDKLVDMLKSDDVGLRGDTASILGRMGLKDAVPALRKAAEDDNPDVKEAALEALEELEKQA
jgi:alkyl hydroperoxide reductase subunit AhpF